jgi:hypothetical protein
MMSLPPGIPPRNDLLDVVLPLVFMGAIALLSLWMFAEWGIFGWDWAFLGPWLLGTASAACLILSDDG